MKNATARLTSRRFLLLMLAMALTCFLPFLRAEEEDIPEARHAWMGGYQAMTQADKAMEKHADLDALHDYQKALEIFQKVQRYYPRWNVSLLRFRVDYCRKQIEALKASNAQNLDFLTKEELLATVNRQSEDLQTLREQNGELSRTLKAAQSSLESARTEAAQAAVSQENLQLLRQERETLNAQIRLLTAQLASAKEDLQKARAEVDANRLAETERQLAAVRKELAETARRLEASQKERKQLSDRIVQSESRLKAQEERLANAEKAALAARKSLETQRAENRQLQGEVTRLREKATIDSTKITGELPQLQAQLRNREEELHSAQLEVMTLKRKLTQAEESATSFSSTISEQSKRLQADGALLAEKLAEAESLAKEKAKLEAKLQENAITLASHREMLAKMEQAASQAERQLADLKASSSKLEQAASQAERQLADLKASSSKLEEKLGEAETTLKQKQHLQEAADGITANAAKLELELQKERAEKAVLAEQKKTLEERLTSLGNGEIDNTRLHEQSMRDLDELVSLRVKTAALEQQLSASTSAAKESRQKLEALIAAADAPQRSLQELQMELADVRRKAKELEDSSALASDLQNARKRIAELELSSREAPEKLRQLLRRNADDLESLWSRRLKETESRMNAEVAKRQELEAALVKSDNARQALEQEVLRNRNTQETAEAQNIRGDALTGRKDGSGAFASSTGTGKSSATLSITDEIILKGYLRQGVDAEQKGRQETAQWNYEQALKMQPDNPIALKRLGLIAANRGDDQTAATYLGQAFRLTPDDHEVLLGLGFAMIQLNQPLWALAGLSRAAALRPDDPEVLRLFGIALSTMHWQEAAEVQLKRALQLRKDDAEAAFNLAMLELARASELRQQARQEQKSRAALEALAAARRADALKWYRQAVANGAQADPDLERALGTAEKGK